MRGKTPGRAVKTRWVSLSSIEEIIKQRRLVLHSAFQRAPPQSSGRKRGRECKGILAEEAEEHRNASRKFTSVATASLGHPKFIVKVCISRVAQCPLRTPHLLAQKKQ